MSLLPVYLKNLRVFQPRQIRYSAVHVNSSCFSDFASPQPLDKANKPYSIIEAKTWKVHVIFTYIPAKKQSAKSHGLPSL